MGDPVHCIGRFIIFCDPGTVSLHRVRFLSTPVQFLCRPLFGLCREDLKHNRRCRRFVFLHISSAILPFPPFSPSPFLVFLSSRGGTPHSQAPSSSFHHARTSSPNSCSLRVHSRDELKRHTQTWYVSWLCRRRVRAFRRLRVCLCLRWRRRPCGFGFSSGRRQHQPRSPRCLRRKLTFRGEPVAANTNLRSPRDLRRKPKIAVSPTHHPKIRLLSSP